MRMSQIKVNIDKVENSAKSLSRNSSELSYIKTDVYGLKSSIDSKIQNRRGVSRRLSSASMDVNDLYKRISQLNAVVENSMEKYWEAEKKIIGKNDWGQFVRSITLGVGAVLADPKSFFRAGKDLRFKMFKEKGKVFFKIAGGKKNIQYLDLFKKYLGDSHPWTNPRTVKRLLKDGIALYDKNKKKFYSKTLDLYATSKFGDLSQYVKDLDENKFKLMGKRALATGVDELKIWDDFGGWKGAEGMVKASKGAGLLGLGYTVFDNVKDNFYDPTTDKWSASGTKIKEFTVDMGVEVGVGAASMATGAAVGSFFLPPVGTVVGAGVGVAISSATNIKFGGPPAESIVDRTKNFANDVVDKGADMFKNIGGAIGKGLSKFW